MNRIQALIASALVAFISLAAISPAVAATEDEQAKACRGDAMHFCAEDIPNKEKITACMKQHVSELSPACRAMFRTGKKGQAK